MCRVRPYHMEGINGDKPHFLYENVLFLTKWGLSPFILIALITFRFDKLNPYVEQNLIKRMGLMNQAPTKWFDESNSYR